MTSIVEPALKVTKLQWSFDLPGPRKDDYSNYRVHLGSISLLLPLLLRHFPLN